MIGSSSSYSSLFSRLRPRSTAPPSTAWRHLPLCATLADPAVHRIAEVLPSTSRGVYETAVAQRLLAERRETLQLLRRSGAIVVDVPADKLVASVVNRYLDMKASGQL